MELSEALPILRRLYAPRFPGLELRVLENHICDRDHAPGECPHPDSAKYTQLDAMLDTAPSLEKRLASGGALKPQRGEPLFFTHIREAVRTLKGTTQ